MLSLPVRRGFSCALVLIFLFLPGYGYALFKDGKKNPPPRKLIPNELIVKLRSGPVSSDNSGTRSLSSSDVFSSKNLRSIADRYGVKRIDRAIFGKTSKKGSFASMSTDTSQIYKITFSNTNGTDIKAIAEEFKRDPSVAYAEPNYLFVINKSPNDPYYDRQWGLEKICASKGWDSTIGDPGIIIAVVDTGVDYTHPDLASNIWVNQDEIPGNGIDDDGNGFIDDVRGWDFVSVPPDRVAPGEDPGPEDNDPMDFVGHGTHVSGIAAGRSNNSIGTAGMSWDCKIMPVRAGYAASDGWGYLEYYDAGRAVMYAADNGANIINMSWGGLEDDDFIRESIEYARSKGCVLVASAGNVESEYAELPYYPAYYPGVVSVAATDDDDMLSIWNFYVFSNFGSWVDVCAPGTYILSTLPGKTYGYYSGTSMSAPFVCGLAALVKARYPYMTSDQVIERILDTADNIDGKNPGFLAGKLGSGRINAFRALGSVSISIDYPHYGECIGSEVLIKGSADVEGFKDYKIEYGVGGDPNIWNRVGGDHTMPVKSELLEKWDTSALSGDFTVRLTVTDISGESYVATTKVNVSAATDAKLVRAPFPAPNPFNPLDHTPMKIHFELGSVPSGGVDIDFCVWDLAGNKVWKRTRHFAAAGEYDELWDGVTSFGERLSGGVYPLMLVADKKVIGKSKIAVVK